MFRDLTAAEILGTGIDQAIMHGAPSDMITRLRGALAFVTAAPDEPKETSATWVEAIPPLDSAVVQDA